MPTYILGISALYHDAAATLLRDGVVVAASQEERFTRLKHDASLPVRAVDFCLEEAGITIQDVDWMVFYEKPLRKFERILSTAVGHVPTVLADVPAPDAFMARRQALASHEAGRDLRGATGPVDVLRPPPVACRKCAAGIATL